MCPKIVSKSRARAPASACAAACLTVAVFTAATVNAGAAWAAPESSPRIVHGLVTSADPAVGALVWDYGKVCIGGANSWAVCTADADCPDSNCLDLGLELSCSGTLIGCSTFLTAAHCVCFDFEAQAGACESGANQALANNKVYLQHAGIFDAASIHVHPGYEFDLIDDVAVIKLAQEVTRISPSSINSLATPSPGTTGTIVGFGNTRYGAFDAGLKRSGTVTVGTCTAAWTPEPEYLCWDYDGPSGAAGSDSNTCSGDSGGPLFVDLGSGPVVAGITSGGTGKCVGPDEASDANVFNAAAFIASAAGSDLGAARCGQGLSHVGDPEASATEIIASLGFVRDGLRCRSKLDKLGAKYLRTKQRLMQRCIYKISSGAAGGPCPDARTQSKLAKLADKMSAAKLRRKCAPGTVQTMLAAGPCSGAADASDISACLLSTSESAADSLLALSHAVTDTVISSRDARKCQKSVARAVGQYAGRHHKLLTACRRDHDNGDVESCPGVETAVELIALRVRLDSKVTAKCSDANIAALNALGPFGGGCAAATTTPAMTECLATGAAGTVQSIFGLLGPAQPRSRFTFTVPAGTELLRVSLNAAEEELAVMHLHLSTDGPATIADAGSTNEGGFQFFEQPTPTAGTWHLLVEPAYGPWVDVGPYQLTVGVFGP